MNQNFYEDLAVALAKKQISYIKGLKKPIFDAADQTSEAVKVLTEEVKAIAAKQRKIESQNLEILQLLKNLTGESLKINKTDKPIIEVVARPPKKDYPKKKGGKRSIEDITNEL